MDHGPATDWSSDRASSFKTRVDIWMFILYAIIYAGFVLINAFNPHFSPGFAFLRWAQALLSDGKWFVSNKRIRQEGLDDDRV